MKEAVKPVLFWAPRTLCLLFAAFVSLFTLNVFGVGYGFWLTIVALIMHVIPTGIILIALAVAWRWEWIDAILFSALGLWYTVMAWGMFPLTTHLSISGPAFLIRILCLVNWLERLGSRGSVAGR